MVIASHLYGNGNDNGHQKHGIEVEKKPSEEVVFGANDLMAQKTKKMKTEDILLDTGENIKHV